MMPTSVDVFDELAALFLTEPDETPRAVLRPAAAEQADLKPGEPSGSIPAPPMAPSAFPTVRPKVEALLVGHLPVRASLWLGPYADAVARQHGPAALIRLDESDLSIELFRGSAPAGLDRDARLAVHALAGEVSTWIVRGSAGSIIDAAAAATVDRISILTSSDEAASVALYQTIKELAEASAQRDRRLPPLALAVVGCDQQRASELVQRLNRTTSTFLGVEATLGICLPHIDAGVRSTGHWSFNTQEEVQLPAALEWIEEGAKAPRAATMEHAPLGRIGMSPTTPICRFDLAPTPAPRGAAEPAVATSSAPRPTPAGIKLPPKPAAMASAVLEAKAPAAPREPDDAGAPLPLAAHVEGLVALPVRCPGRERVEIAVDSSGRLHAIAWDTNLRDLLAVEAWAQAHRELIGMACPQRALDAGARVVCHVFTDRPAAVADLHGSQLHLHVLAPVRLASQTAWYAAPLNALSA